MKFEYSLAAPILQNFNKIVILNPTLHFKQISSFTFVAKSQEQGCFKTLVAKSDLRSSCFAVGHHVGVILIEVDDDGPQEGRPAFNDDVGVNGQGSRLVAHIVEVRHSKPGTRARFLKKETEFNFSLFNNHSKSKKNCSITYQI